MGNSSDPTNQTQLTSEQLAESVAQTYTPQDSPVLPTNDNKKSSVGMLLGGILLAVVILVSGAMLYMSFSKKSMLSQQLSTQRQENVDAAVRSQTELDKDTQEIDSQLTEITKNESNVDQALNDQQVDLEE